MTDRVKGTVEGYRSLAASKLKRQGHLVPGHAGQWGWWNGDKLKASISTACVDRNYVRFAYDCAGESYDYIVALEWLPCHLGGERVMFRCPRCSRRCAKLLADRVFACRACVGVNYSSQQQAKRDVASQQSWKLRRKLGCDFGFLDAPAHCIPKPKWMRWSTYWRMLERIERYDQQAIAGLEKELSRMLGQLGR